MYLIHSYFLLSFVIVTYNVYSLPLALKSIFLWARTETKQGPMVKEFSLKYRYEKNSVIFRGDCEQRYSLSNHNLTCKLYIARKNDL